MGKSLQWQWPMTPRVTLNQTRRCALLGMLRVSWMIHPNTYTCYMFCAMLVALSNNHCRVSSPSIFMLRPGWTECPRYKFSLDPKGRHYLYSYSSIIDLVSCFSMFSVACADLCSSCWLILGLHTFLNNSLFTHWNSFTFKDLLTDDKRYAAVIDCEHLGAGEALSYFAFLRACQCYIRVCWICSHCIMDLSVSQEKWIRHWSKACPACLKSGSKSVTGSHCSINASSVHCSTATMALFAGDLANICCFECPFFIQVIVMAK